MASPIENASIDTFESSLIDNYTEKFHVFEALTRSYYAQNDYETAFEYGSQWLILGPQLPVYSDYGVSLGSIREGKGFRAGLGLVLVPMIKLSHHFCEFEIEEICLREHLKIQIINYNQGEKHLVLLLMASHNLIEFYLETNGNYKMGLNIFLT